MTAGAALLVATAMPVVSAGVARAANDPPGTIYVADNGTNAIDVFPPGAQGNVAPERVITGPDTGLDGPGDVKVSSSGVTYVTNFSADSITEYAPGASGDASPICTISGASTDLDFPDDMSLLPDGTLVVGSFEDVMSGGAGAVTVYRPGACGNVSPTQDIAGSSTGFDQVDGVGADADGTIFAASTDSNSIQVFSPGSTGNVAPEYTITGGGVDTPDDVVVGFDGKVYVTNGFGTATPGISVYAPGAQGDATPAQDISGPTTDFAFPDDLAVDSAGDIYVTDASSAYGGTTTPAVLEWNAGANGDVAPNAVLAGSNTTFVTPEGVFVTGASSSSSAGMTTAAAATGIPAGGSTSDTATLSGGSTAPTGSLVFKFFGPNDPTCSNAPAFTSPAVPVTGDGSYSSGSFTPKATGTYSWQAEYSGDASNAAITSPCGDPADTVTVGVTATTVTTLLVYGEGQTGTSILVPSGTAVFDNVTLSGSSAGSASGTVTYNVYSDAACTILADGGSPQAVSGGDAPESQPVTLTTPGTYYWQAVYSGDSSNAASSSTCGPNGEVETVQPGSTPIALATSLSGGDSSGTSISVPAGTAVTDTVTATGAAASSATGSVTYDVYSDAACTTLVSIGTAQPIITAGTFPPSRPVTLAAPGTYYWQASYTGDATNAAAQSPCGASGEVETVTSTVAGTSLATSLSGGGQAGVAITVPAGTPVTDSATLSGANAARATGSVTYNVYSDDTCTTLVKGGTAEPITTAGLLPPSAAVALTVAGTYYWRASYSGDPSDLASASACGAEKLTVIPLPAIDTLTTAWGKSTATARVASTVTGDLIVAFVAANGPGGKLQTATVSGGGLAWHLVSRRNPAGSDTEVWSATATGKLTGVTVTVRGGLAGYDEVVTVIAVKNAHTAGPTSFASSAKGAPRGTLTTTASNAWVFAVGADWSTYAKPVAASGQLLLSAVDAPGGKTVWVQATSTLTPRSGTTVTISDTAPVTHPFDLLLVAIE